MVPDARGDLFGRLELLHRGSTATRHAQPPPGLVLLARTFLLEIILRRFEFGIDHTDAMDTMEYNNAPPWRRASAVVGYITRNFAVDPAHVVARRMGKRGADAGRNDTLSIWTLPLVAFTGDCPRI